MNILHCVLLYTACFGKCSRSSWYSMHTFSLHTVHNMNTIFCRMLYCMMIFFSTHIPCIRVLLSNTAPFSMSHSRSWPILELDLLWYSSIWAKIYLVSHTFFIDTLLVDRLNFIFVVYEYHFPPQKNEMCGGLLMLILTVLDEPLR